MLDNDIERKFNSEAEMYKLFNSVNVAKYISKFFSEVEIIFILRNLEEANDLRKLLFYCKHRAYDQEKLENAPTGLIFSFKKNPDLIRYLLFPKFTWCKLEDYPKLPLIDIKTFKYVLKDFILKDLNDNKEDIHFKI
jgi:hypothetical protein